MDAEDAEALSLGQVPSCEGGQLFISWGLGNELEIAGLSANASDESSASCVRWGCLPAAQRRIAYDSLGKYSELQARMAEHGGDGSGGGSARPWPDAWADVLDYAQTLSAVLAADGARAAELSGDELFSLQERALWELLALFFLEPPGAAAASLAGADLARWLRRNAAAVAGPGDALPLPPGLLAQLREAALPEAHPRYWPALARCVALGWAGEAVELLGLHSAWLAWEPAAAAAGGADPAAAPQVAALEAATLLLRRFPTLAGAAGETGGGGTVRALLAEDELWGSCRAADPGTAQGLRAALAVAAGEEGALAAAAASWPELLVAQLLHAHPAARPQAELRDLLARCCAAAPPEGAGGSGPPPGFLAALAGVLDACAEGEPQAAMRAASVFCSDWFMAHAPELMAAHPAGASVLSAELAHAGGSQVEFYRLDYACALMPHAATWRLAAAQLAWCPAHGRGALEALLRRLPLKGSDARRGAAAAALAEAQGLAGVARALAVRQGVADWQAGLLGAALAWFARADDCRRADVALRPLAAAVSRAGGAWSQRAAAVCEALAPALAGLPAGSVNAALLQVHRLLRRGQGLGSLQAAVEALARLPPAVRDGCLPLVNAALPALPPGALREPDVLRLLEWLQGAEERLPASRAGPEEKAALARGISISRLALVRALAAAHLVQQHPQAAAWAAA